MVISPKKSVHVGISLSPLGPESASHISLDALPGREELQGVDKKQGKY